MVLASTLPVKVGGNEYTLVIMSENKSKWIRKTSGLVNSIINLANNADCLKLPKRPSKCIERLSAIHTQLELLSKNRFVFKYSFVLAFLPKQTKT